MHVQAAALKLEELALLDSAFVLLAQPLELFGGLAVHAVHHVERAVQVLDPLQRLPQLRRLRGTPPSGRFAAVQRAIFKLGSLAAQDGVRELKRVEGRLHHVINSLRFDEAPRGGASARGAACSAVPAPAGRAQQLHRTAVFALANLLDHAVEALLRTNQILHFLGHLLEVDPSAKRGLVTSRARAQHHLRSQRGHAPGRQLVARTRPAGGRRSLTRGVLGASAGLVVKSEVGLLTWRTHGAQLRPQGPVLGSQSPDLGVPLQLGAQPPVLLPEEVLLVGRGRGGRGATKNTVVECRRTHRQLRGGCLLVDLFTTGSLSREVAEKMREAAQLRGEILRLHVLGDGGGLQLSQVHLVVRLQLLHVQTLSEVQVLEKARKPLKLVPPGIRLPLLLQSGSEQNLEAANPFAAEEGIGVIFLLSAFRKRRGALVEARARDGAATAHVREAGAEGLDLVHKAVDGATELLVAHRGTSDVLRTRRELQRRHRLRVAGGRGRDVGADDGLGVAAQRVAQEECQLAVAVGHETPPGERRRVVALSPRPLLPRERHDDVGQRAEALVDGPGLLHAQRLPARRDGAADAGADGGGGGQRAVGGGLLTLGAGEVDEGEAGDGGRGDAGGRLRPLNRQGENRVGARASLVQVRGADVPALDALPEDLEGLSERRHCRFRQLLDVHAAVDILPDLEACAARLQQVHDLLLVDLQERAAERVRIAVLGSSSRDLREDVVQHAADQAPALVKLQGLRRGHGPRHRVGLTRACLAINVDAAVVAGEAAGSNCTAHELKRLFLRRLWVEDTIEGEVPRRISS
mmetsp:Transcript_9032/g.31986  ORF Transcript_9032/g.31986 Transcript_9032/m.31986 type:complete len:805 (-) Transcript_9032:327-2741(-)